MFCLVVLLESVIGCEDLGGDDEIMRGWVERPKIGAKHHDTEGDVQFIVVLFHACFESICEVFAQAHIYARILKDVKLREAEENYQ